MIQQITVDGLRGFATPQTLSIAVPNGAPGSGVTVLVGPNNGGKSTVIDALAALSKNRPQSFTVGKRNHLAGDRVVLTATDTGGQQRRLASKATGGSETEYQGGADVGRILAVASRRFFNPGFGKSDLSRNVYIENYDLPQTRGAAVDHFAGRLFRIQEHRQQFDAVFERVVSPAPSWAIDQSDQGNYFIKFVVGPTYHTSDGIGDGLVSLMFLIDALYDSAPGDIIALDEPELSLHPAHQRKLADLIADYAKDRQILVATHSPYFVDVPAAINGGAIARVHRDSHGRSIISAVTRNTFNDLQGFFQNVNNPHIFGLDAREVFFLQDGVILVEGQEDVVLYRRLASELKIDLKGSFFGWGTGGADNMKVISSLLKDLGFSKVVGILDANKGDRIPDLQRTFPQFYFHAIPADDIRSKPPQAAKDGTRGLLDEIFKVRPEYEAQVRALLREVERVLA